MTLTCTAFEAKNKNILCELVNKFLLELSEEQKKDIQIQFACAGVGNRSMMTQNGDVQHFAYILYKSN